MIRSYADEIVEEINTTVSAKGFIPYKLSWCKANYGSLEHKVYKLMRGFSMHMHIHIHRIVAENIYKAYGLNVDFSEQEKRAQEHWLNSHKRIGHLTFDQIDELVLEVKKKDIDILLNELPNTVYDKIQPKKVMLVNQ